MNLIQKMKAKTIMSAFAVTIIIASFVFWLIGEKEAVFEKNDSFWSKETIPVNVALNQNIDVDVAIIGGGYTVFRLRTI